MMPIVIPIDWNIWKVNIAKTPVIKYDPNGSPANRAMR